MPRKPFTETSYNPIAADLAREVAATGRGPVTAAAQPLPSRRAVPTVTKRVVLTRKEDDDLNLFLLRVQAQAGARVPFTLLARAALSLLQHAEDQIIEELRTPFSYPATGDRLAQGDFEDQWTRCLARANKTPGDGADPAVRPRVNVFTECLQRLLLLAASRVRAAVNTVYSLPTHLMSAEKSPSVWSWRRIFLYRR